MAIWPWKRKQQSTTTRAMNSGVMVPLPYSPPYRRQPPPRQIVAVSDAGMISHYQQAQHQKTGGIAGFIRRFSNLYNRVTNRVPPSKTTEQGAASAASPLTFQYSLYALRYERRAMIADCRQMVLDDPRANKATTKFAREAVRKGCTITIDRKYKKGPGARRFTIAEECAKKVQDICNTELFSWAWMIHIEGDLFIQAIVADDELVDAKRMPAAAMERNTDDTDEFVDPEEAFSQVDVNSNQEVATFPLALMWHGRWRHVDGERYGLPEIVSGRRLRRLLELQEDAQAVRRMTRAAQRRLWIVGDKDNPAPDDEVDAFKERNGFVEGRQEIFDPINVATDIFGNGLVDAKTLDGDRNVGDVNDLRYAQNVYATCLPTPAPLYNLDAEAVNRDVLDDLRSEWLKETVTLSDKMKELVGWVFSLALLLKGILPETVPFAVHFSESSVETPSAIVDRIVKLRQNVLAPGRNATPDPLVSRLHALQLLAEITDVDDVESELADIEKELAEREMELEQAALRTSQALSLSGPKPGDTKPVSSGSNGSNGNGRSATASRQ